MINKPRVFVSRSLHDEAFTLRFVEDLIAGGVAVWLNDAQTDDGTLTPRQLDTLMSCEWLVVVQTPEALASPTVNAELNAALRAASTAPRRGIIAVIAAPCDLSTSSTVWRSLLCYDVDRLGYDLALQGVLRTLQSASLTLPDAGVAGVVARTPAPPPITWPTSSPSGSGASSPFGPLYNSNADGAPMIPPKKPMQPPQIGRRELLIGAGIVGAALVAGGGIFLLRGLHPKTSTTVIVAPTATQPLSPGRLIFSYTGHTGVVNTAQWSPVAGSNRIVSASEDQTAQVWTVGNQSTLVRFAQDSAGVVSADWSRQGDRIVTASNDSTVQIWSATTGAVQVAYTGHSGAKQLAAARWSPDNTRIASGGSGGVQVWRVNDQSLVAAYNQQGVVSDLTWSPDGTKIASASFGGTVDIWDATSGAQLARYMGHQGAWVFTVVWSRNGKYLASAGTTQGVRVWDAATLNDAQIYLGHRNGVNGISWSHDSQFIASCGGDSTPNSPSRGYGDTSVQVWQALTGKLVTKYTGHPRYVNGVSWSPDDTTIASGSDDRTVQVWRVH